MDQYSCMLFLTIKFLESETGLEWGMSHYPVTTFLWQSVIFDKAREEFPSSNSYIKIESGQHQMSVSNKTVLIYCISFIL